MFLFAACHKLNIERISNNLRRKKEKDNELDIEKHLSSSSSPFPLSPVSPISAQEQDSPFSAQELGLIQTNSTMESTPSPVESRRQLFNPLRGRGSRQRTNSTGDSTHSQQAAAPMGRKGRESLTIDTGAAAATPKGYVTPRFGAKKRDAAMGEAKKPPVPPKTPKMQGAGPVKTPRKTSAAALATPTKTPLAPGLAATPKKIGLGALTSPKSKWKVRSVEELAWIPTSCVTRLLLRPLVAFVAGPGRYDSK